MNFTASRAAWSAACGSLALCALAAGAPARAQHVQAGTEIVNKATASYNTGTATKTIESNEIRVKVDELLDVAVATLSSGAQSASSSAATLAFSVTNTGNGDEAFKLTANPTVSGNQFDGTIQTVAVDVNGNGVYDPNVDTVVANGTAGPVIPAEGSIKVVVVVALPAGATDAQTSQVRLTAEAVTGTGAPGKVFAGQGTGGVDAVVGASGADDDKLGALIASLATVTLTKTQAITDPFGGTQPVPGATVTYTIAAKVDGTGKAENLHVADLIPAGTTYQAGTLKLDSTALSDAADSDAGSASQSAGIDVALGTVAGGASHSVTFQVKIN